MFRIRGKEETAGYGQNSMFTDFFMIVILARGVVSMGVQILVNFLISSIFVLNVFSNVLLFFLSFQIVHLHN